MVDVKHVESRSGLVRCGFWLLQSVRIGLAGCAFIGFGGGAFLLSWLVLPIVSVLTRGDERRLRRCQRIVQAAFALFHDGMRVAGLVDFDPRAPRIAPPAGPFVLVANHPTLVDISALVSAFGPMCYLAKRPLFSNPLIGPLLRFCGQIPGGGSTFADNVGVVQQAVDRLRRGHSVLLFPEGTRSPAGGMHPFRRGAFEIARQAGVPVVPVVIRAEPPGLYRGLAWYEIPKRAIVIEIEVLSAIPAGTAASALAFEAIHGGLTHAPRGDAACEALSSSPA